MLNDQAVFEPGKLDSHPLPCDQPVARMVLRRPGLFHWGHRFARCSLGRRARLTGDRILTQGSGKLEYTDFPPWEDLGRIPDHLPVRCEDASVNVVGAVVLI